MSLKDWIIPKFNPLPTRHGAAIGHSAENRMLAITEVDGIRKRFQTNPDGSVTMLVTRAGMPEFTTVRLPPGVVLDTSIYLDNGFVEAGLHGLMATTDEVQAVTLMESGTTAGRYAQVVASAIKVTPKLFSTFFKSFSTKKKSTDAPSTDYIETLKTKNVAITQTPPTMFTGMARRYVSAIYGREIKDAADKGLSGSGGTVTYAGVPLSSGFPTTGVVFSMAHKKYWMISAGTHSMTYQEMVITAAGKEILTAISAGNGDELNNILHAYVLSQATVLSSGGSVTFRDGGEFTSTVIGSPLSFGWRFNADGSKATLCTMLKPNETFCDSYRYSATITVTENGAFPVGDPLRFELAMDITLEESVLAWTCNKLMLFYPLAIDQYQWARTGYTATTEVLHAPLCSFFDDLDVEQVCRFSFTPGTATPYNSFSSSGQVLTADGYPPTSNAQAFYGWGSGYSIQASTHTAGDGALTSLGGIIAAEAKLSSSTDYTYVITPTEEYKVGSQVTTAGTPMQVGRSTFGVNGSVNTGLTATWPYSSTVVVYRKDYTWAVTGEYATSKNVIVRTMLVLPGDCATAWIESAHVSETKTGASTFVAPGGAWATQHTHRCIQLNTQTYEEYGDSVYLQSQLVSLNYNTQSISDTTTAENSSFVRNAKGRSQINGMSNVTGEAPGPFWAATVGNPIVDFAMCVQDDMKSVFRASSVLGATDLVSGWPEPTLRSIGWQ